MPRVGGVMQLLSGTLAVPNTTIQSAPYNAQQQDWVLDANNPRPITAGGTGATTATQARLNLGAIGATDLATAATKATVVDTDSVVIIDSVAPDAGKNKRWLVSALKASLATMTDQQFKLVSTDGGAAADPQFILDRISSTPAEEDLLGFVGFRGRNSTGPTGVTTYAYIQAGITDPVNNQEGGSLKFVTMNGAVGTAVLTPTLTLANGHTTVHHNLGVLGDATFSGAATFNVAPIFNSSPTVNGDLTLASTDASLDSGPNLNFMRNSLSPADGDWLTDIRFYGRNNGNNSTLYASIYAVITDVTGGSEDGSLVFRTMTAGSPTAALLLGPTMSILYSPLTFQSDLISSVAGARLATTGAGTITLRPNGIGSTAGQFVVNPSGNVQADANVVSGSGVFGSLTTNAYLSTNGAGTIKLRPNGSLSAVGEFIVNASGNVQSDAGTYSGNGIFSSLVATLNLSTSATGTINFRPQGPGSSTGMMTLSSAGNLTVAGTISGGSGYLISSNSFISGATSSIWGNDASGTLMTFRPVASGSTAGEMTLGATGTLSITGNVISGTGYFQTPTGDTTLASGTGGTVYLRPNGTGSFIGSLRVTTTTLGVFGETGAARGALAVPTGSIKRTTYATSTVTTGELAGVVMAMITDLKAMGFFS